MVPAPLSIPGFYTSRPPKYVGAITKTRGEDKKKVVNTRQVLNLSHHCQSLSRVAPTYPRSCVKSRLMQKTSTSLFFTSLGVNDINSSPSDSTSLKYLSANWELHKTCSCFQEPQGCLTMERLGCHSLVALQESLFPPDPRKLAMIKIKITK